MLAMVEDREARSNANTLLIIDKMDVDGVDADNDDDEEEEVTTR